MCSCSNVRTSSCVRKFVERYVASSHNSRTSRQSEHVQYKDTTVLPSMERRYASNENGNKGTLNRRIDLRETLELFANVKKLTIKVSEK